MQTADGPTARQTKRYISGMSGLLKLLPFFHLVQTNLYSGDNLITNVLRWLIMCTSHHFLALPSAIEQSELMINSFVYNLIVFVLPHFFLIRCLESKINFNYQPTANKNQQQSDQPFTFVCKLSSQLCTLIYCSKNFLCK